MQQDNKKMKFSRKLILTIGAILLLPVLLWFFFGGGAFLRHKILYDYFGVIPPGNDGTHLLWKDRDEFKKMIERRESDD